MPRYNYLCPECSEKYEVIRSMREATIPATCSKCDVWLERDYQAEGVLVGAGRRSYHKPIVSDSLAILPEQIPEHRKMFPNIEVCPDGRPVFDNFTDHNAYLKKCNFVKAPQKKKKRGIKIS